MAAGAATFSVTVQLFAAAKDLAGGSAQVSLELSGEATVADVREALTAAVPALAAVLQAPSTAFARNEEFADLTDRVYGGDELAILPAVSGG